MRHTDFWGANSSAGTAGSIAGFFEANLSIRMGPFFSFGASGWTSRQGGGATEGFDKRGGAGFDGDGTEGLSVDVDRVGFLLPVRGCSLITFCTDGTGFPFRHTL
jgi:hypothetical protein